jgi:hypothetical protein
MADDKEADLYAKDGLFSGTVTGDFTGNVTGNLTGDVTGNLTGDVTGNLTGDVTGNAATATELSVAIGLDDLNNGYSSETNIVLGETSSTVDITTGLNNTVMAMHDWTGDRITTGSNNTTMGYNAGKKVKTGGNNTMLGTQAGQYIVGGSGNVFIGYNANAPASNAGANNRIVIGSNATAPNGVNNIAIIGNDALNQVWMAEDKGATVHAAEYVGDLTGDVTGNVTGDLTGNADTASALSVAIGLNDLSDVHSNDSNLILGGAYTTQSDQAAYLASFGYSNTNIFGYGAGLGASVPNQVVLGNSSVNYVFAGSDWGASVYAANIAIASDRRFKTDIRDIDSQIENISNIKSKKYINLKTGQTEFGVIAQEIQQVYPDLVTEIDYISDDNKEAKSVKRLAVNYTGFVPILIKTINEQQVIIQELQSKVDEIDELKEELENLKQLIMNNN